MPWAVEDEPPDYDSHYHLPVRQAELDARAKQAIAAGRVWDQAFVQQCPLPEPFAERCRTCRWPNALVAGECRKCAMVRGYQQPLPEAQTHARLA